MVVLIVLSWKYMMVSRALLPRRESTARTAVRVPWIASFHRMQANVVLINIVSSNARQEATIPGIV